MNTTEEDFTVFGDGTFSPFLSLELQDLLQETCTDITLQPPDDDLPDSNDFCARNIQISNVKSLSKPYKFENSASQTVESYSDSDKVEVFVSKQIESVSKFVDAALQHQGESSKTSSTLLEEPVSELNDTLPNSDKIEHSVPQLVENPPTSCTCKDSLPHIVECLSKSDESNNSSSQPSVLFDHDYCISRVYRVSHDHSYFKFTESPTVIGSSLNVLSKNSGISSGKVIMRRRTNKHLEVHRCDICVDFYKINKLVVYRCNMCEKVFDAKCRVSEHFKKIHGGNSCLCIVCGRKFTDEELSDHARTHNCKKFYKCEICEKVFTASECLISHNKTTHRERKYKCDDCGQLFGRLKILSMHRRLVHMQESGNTLLKTKSIQCEICSKKLHHNSLTTHMYLHTGKRPHKCQVCGKTYTTKQSLCTHLKIHTGGGTYICNICGKVLSCRTSLTTHRYIHTGEKPHKCRVCGKMFRAKSSLYTHLKMHAGGGTYIFDICGKVLKTRHSFSFHKFTHTDERPHKCDICSKTFRRLSCLKNHKQCHKDARPYICNDCGATFKMRRGLSLHRRKHVTGKYECKICCKIYTNLLSFSRHKSSHGKLYICDICGLEFKSWSGRQDHRTSVHEKKDPMLCTICGKELFGAKRLKKHLRIHTGEKDFMCEVCGKQFLTRSKLNTHIQIHRQEKPYLCKVCGCAFSSSGGLRHHNRLHNTCKSQGQN